MSKKKRSVTSTCERLGSRWVWEGKKDLFPPDTLVMVRSGGYYLTFGDKAIPCSKAFEIAPYRMYGTEAFMLPCHAVEYELPKLLRVAKIVALLDEDGELLEMFPKLPEE